MGTNTYKYDTVDISTRDAGHHTMPPTQRDTPDTAEMSSRAPNPGHAKDRDENDVTAGAKNGDLNNPELVAMALAELQKSEEGGRNGPNRLSEGIE